MSCAVMPKPSRTHAIPRDGPATLVASTSFCRTPGCLVNQFPKIVSVAPKVSALVGTEYISDVSKKFTPRSRERSRIACESASLTCSPKVIVPKQIGVTRKSLLPSETKGKDISRTPRIGFSKPVSLIPRLKSGSFLFLQAKYPPLHLTRRGHGQLSDKFNLFGVFIRRQLAAHVGLQLSDEGFTGLKTWR